MPLILGGQKPKWAVSPSRVCATVLEFSTSADGGLSGGSRVRRHGSEDPHRREQNFLQTV